jgi:hypothetical protein
VSASSLSPPPPPLRSLLLPLLFIRLRSRFPLSDPVYWAVMGMPFFDSVAPVSASLAEIVDPVSLPVSQAMISVSPLVM